jgi:hypothetical protein
MKAFLQYCLLIPFVVCDDAYSQVLKINNISISQLSLHETNTNNAQFIHKSKAKSKSFTTIDPKIYTMLSNEELSEYGFRVFNETFIKLHADYVDNLFYSGIEPCRDKGECFSGAWMGSMWHILQNPGLRIFNTSRRAHMLKRAVCEDATFWFMHKMLRLKKHNHRFGNSPGKIR